MNPLNSLWVFIGQLRVACHLNWLMSENNFQTQNLFFHVSYSLNVAAVVRFKQRLALSDGADALETIKSQSRSPPSSVTTQQSPKHQNKGATLVEVGPIPHSSKCLSTESAGICCVPTDPTRRGTRKQKKVTKRERQQFKLLLLAPPRVKDGFLE